MTRKNSRQRKLNRPVTAAAASPQLPVIDATPWYKRGWLVAGWVVSTTLVGAFFTFLLNGPLFFQSLRKLPAEVSQTNSEYQSWVKEDKEWTGNWSSFPEGYVDMADMNLSDVDMQITIWSSQGEIDGTIATKAICRSIPLFNYVLLRGTVSGDTATVIAWDIIQGHKTDFAELTLTRDGTVITVTPISGRKDWFPSTARLGLHPMEEDEEPNPDQTYCAAERNEFLKKLPIPSKDNGLTTQSR